MRELRLGEEELHLLSRRYGRGLWFLSPHSFRNGDRAADRICVPGRQCFRDIRDDCLLAAKVVGSVKGPGSLGLGCHVCSQGLAAILMLSFHHTLRRAPHPLPLAFRPGSSTWIDGKRAPIAAAHSTGAAHTLRRQEDLAAVPVVEPQRHAVVLLDADAADARDGDASSPWPVGAPYHHTISLLLKSMRLPHPNLRTIASSAPPPINGPNGEDDGAHPGRTRDLAAISFRGKQQGRDDEYGARNHQGIHVPGRPRVRRVGGKRIGRVGGLRHQIRQPEWIAAMPPVRLR